MKRIICAYLVLAVLFAAPLASAQLLFDGKVTGEKTVGVLAPFGGIIEDVYVNAGDRVNLSDAVATMKTTRVYAPVDGTVSGIFAVEGDLVETVTERYGAIMYVAPVRKYSVSASTEKAYNLSENKFINIGESVYLRCTTDGRHRGTGIVVGTGENGAYTIEVTGGEFSMEEVVGVFRNPNYAATSRIGRGKVSAVSAVAVKGTGSVLRIHVENGDKVERGELLFECVEGALDGMYAPGRDVISDVSGIVSTIDAQPGTAVEKDAKILTVYPDSSLRVEIDVMESDLGFLDVGTPVAMVFGWDPEQEVRTSGEITNISYISSAESGEPMYKAFISF
ncbi:MAG: HlyD family efflux transporter periplasmic adaptor subunit, partial [Clostridia bacterium]|nr:HlyD family efflux transporter periplasmic adaptor subunit [Clostridia bacterium]